MLNKLKLKWMAFRDIFKDSNDINEKTVVGFASFAIMTIFAVVDLVTGYFGKDLVINEFIYDRIRDSIGMKSTFLIMGAPGTVKMIYHVIMLGDADSYAR